MFRPLLTSLLLYSSCYLSIDVSTVKNTLREIILSCIFAVMVSCACIASVTITSIRLMLSKPKLKTKREMYTNFNTRPV